MTLKENRDTVSVSISDKGMPYVLTPKQREMLKGGLVSAFSFDQLAIEGQRLGDRGRFSVSPCACLCFLKRDIEKSIHWRCNMKHNVSCRFEVSFTVKGGEI